MSHASWRSYLLLTVLLAAVLVPFIGGTSLMGPWEPHYGQVAREMLHDGNWLDPHYEGQTFWTKPILAPFLATASYAVFGETSFATRLPAVLVGALGFFGVMAFFRRRYGERTAWFATLALLLTPYMALMSRRFLTDIFYTMPLLLGLLWMFEALEWNKPRRAILGWAMLALAVLAKGLLPLFIAFGTLAATLVLSGSWRHWRRLAPLAGPAVFLVIAVPWHAYMTAKYGPEFLRVWFIENHFQRAAGSIHKPTGMFDFLFKYLGLGMFPVAMAWPFAGLAWRRREPGDEATPRLAFFLLAYTAAAALCVFFSATKFAHYSLAVVPPVAILIGMGLAQLESLGVAERPWRLAMLLLAGVSAVILGHDFAYGDNWTNFVQLTSDHKVRDWFGDVVQVAWPMYLTTAGLLAALGLLIWERRLWQRMGMAVLGVVMLGYLGWFLFVLDPAFLEVFSAKPLMETYLQQRHSGEPLFLLNDWKDRNMVWEGDVTKPFIRVHNVNELATQLRNMPKGRFFVSYPREEADGLKAAIQRLTGGTLTVLASDRFRSYEGEFIGVANWGGTQAAPPPPAPETKAEAPKNNRFFNPAFVIQARFQRVTLVGADAPSSLGTGPAEFVLYWRADDKIPSDYQRLLTLERDGSVVAKTEAAPATGTSNWQRNTIIRDTISLPLPALRPGRYSLYVSLANGAEKVPVLEKGDTRDPQRVLITEWRVSGK